MEENKQEKIMCPNSLPVIGGVVLGIVNEDQGITLLPEPEPVTPEFYKMVIKDTGLEAQFRFSSPCVEGKCRHWTGHACDVPSRVMQSIEENIAADTALPECFIRASCRWFGQDGAKACMACTEVVNFETSKNQHLRMI